MVVNGSWWWLMVVGGGWWWWLMVVGLRNGIEAVETLTQLPR